MGCSLRSLARFDDAVEALQEALYAGQAGAHDRIVASAAAELVYVLGVKLRNFKRGSEWRRLADASANRVGDQRVLQKWRRIEGNLYYRGGKLDRAHELLSAAVRLSIAAHGENHLQTYASILSLGTVEAERGNLEDAEKLQRRALNIIETLVGEKHPETALTLNNLGNLLAEQGRYDEAERAHERALALRREAFGPDHTDVAQSQSNLSEFSFRRGEYERARQLLESALRTHRATLGADNPRLAHPLVNLGYVSEVQGDHAAARAYLQEAHQLRVRQQGEDHPSTLAVAAALGMALVGDGALDLAEETCTRILALAGESTSSHTRGTALLCRGRVAEERRDMALARKLFSEALDVLGDTPDTERADAAFGLARAVDLLKPDRAIELAQQARELYLKGGVPSTRKRLTVDAWLRARGQQPNVIEGE